MAQPTKVPNKTYSSVELPLEGGKEISYNKEVDTVSIQLLVDATVKVTGTVTGTQYVFHGAGSVVEVNIQDKDELLNKTRGRSCCGGQSSKNIFALV